MNIVSELTTVDDLTTVRSGVHPDAEALVYRQPRVERPVPGVQWNGRIGRANAVLRLPAQAHWNGKLLIGGIPAVRTEYALDLLLSDHALQRGYAYAACDKGTPLLTLRDTSRSMAEWESSYQQLTHTARHVVQAVYGQPPARTYISGVSNGGYVTRMMMERHPDLYDGGIENEGVLWHPDGRHLLTCLPVYLDAYPVFRNWRGDATAAERARALERLVDAGLHPQSQSAWDQYFLVYWVVSLWLYGRTVDPGWAPFEAAWNNDWLRNPADLAAYPWWERREATQHRIADIANTGRLTKPLLSVAGNWDCLVPYRHHADAYARLVDAQDCSANHRLYEVDAANHVDGLLRQQRGRQQPVHPFYEAGLHHLEQWVENGVEPPPSGLYADIGQFARDAKLYTLAGEGEPL